MFNAIQIKLLMRSAELSVPEYDEVFRDDDEDVIYYFFISVKLTDHLTNLTVT